MQQAMGRSEQAMLLCLLPDPANLCTNKKAEETISKRPSKTTFTTDNFTLNRFQLAGYIKTVCLKHKIKLKKKPKKH